MTVYVESNFVIELALEQEQCESCEKIVDLARSGQISLIVPAFSLAEPHQAIALKEKARNRLSNDLRHHLSELGRSRPYRSVPDEYRALVRVLILSAERERDGLQRAVSTLLDSAQVLVLDATVLSSARAIEAEFALSGQDAIVLASVLQHLRNTAPEESCFLNRNSRDFDDPDIREKLGELHCEYFGQFES